MKILLKVGSNILTKGSEGLNVQRIAALARDISVVKGMGHDVILVSSGAVAAGMTKMGLKTYPHDIRIKQAVAAVGQSSLMWAYEKYFKARDIGVAQILLTRDDFKDRIRYLNAKNTITSLLDYGFIPVINENDPISVAEMKFGDNDQLAALVAGMVGVDRMVILSDVPGFYEGDPRTPGKHRLISHVEEITPELLARAGGSGQVGTGGMYSKLIAARRATSHGIPVNIVSGKKEGLIPELVSGKEHGTYFSPTTRSRLSSRKGWIAYSVRCRGAIVLDEGAVKAIVERGKSVLPSGIVRTEGAFGEGDAVACLDQSGNRIAKGLTNYGADEIVKIQGRKTSEIESVLGYKYSDEVIHRDNLVLVTEAGPKALS